MSGKAIAICALAAVMTAAAAARADVFNMPAGQTSLQTVVVGDPGNMGDTAGAIGVGAVNYTYYMGKYEVTNAQYCQFLNAKMPDISDTTLDDQGYLPNDTYGLFNFNDNGPGGPVNLGIAYDPTAAEGAKFSPIAGRANWPVVNVNWNEVLRFTNWLQNGQGNGDTESGTYLILNGGQNSGTIVGYPDSVRANETPAAGHWVLPNQDEWYKAAYYKGGGTNSGYWLYPTQSNSTPWYYPPGIPGADPTNSANYFSGGLPRASDHPIDVGSYPLSVSAYGTLDQGGNAAEWTETTSEYGYAGSSGMILLGGNCDLSAGTLQSSSSLIHGGPGGQTLDDFGFRVAYIPSSEVPEPGSFVLAVAGGLCLLTCAWRRRRKMHNLSTMILAVIVVLGAGSAGADVFNMPSGQTSLQTVFVGDPGNAPDTGGQTGAGAVNYSYYMGTYEVTNAQYCQFLNAKLPNISDTSLDARHWLPSDTYGLFPIPALGSSDLNYGIAYDPSAATGGKFSPVAGRDNWPAVNINWEESLRFVNWLQNGQGNGDTETGTYLISNGGQNTGSLPFPIRSGETASSTGHWVLPSQDEWYKAAYYKGGGTNSGYWVYPTQSNSTPSYYPPGTPGGDPTNSANYFVGGLPRASDHPIDVGSYPLSVSAYGTLDQGGNASEWNEQPASYRPPPPPDGDYEGVEIRGGNCDLGGDLLASANYNVHMGTTGGADDNMGFRVAYVPTAIEVPEPGTILLAVVGGVCLLTCVRRRRRKMHNLGAMILAVIVVLGAGSAGADVFNMPAGQTSLQTVPVGDPGNAPDTLPGQAGAGAVGYNYYMGTYEVTNAQYCQFLNAKLPNISDTSLDAQGYLPNDTYGLCTGSDVGPGGAVNLGIAYDPNAASGAKFSPIAGRDNWPVVNVQWEEALRFVNWLQNGQGNGDTETGTYLISNGGQNTGSVPYPIRSGETPSTAGHWVLPSQDEWYKAAYYKGGGTNSGYWLYPTQSNSTPWYYPPGTPGGDPTNSANYFSAGLPRASDHPIDVGSYPLSVSAYGTLDQGGNAAEWNEMPANYEGGLGGSDFSMVEVRGGGCDLGAGFLQSSIYNAHMGTVGGTLDYFGFRVAYVPTIEVPEPGSFALLVSGVAVVLIWRRRR